MRDFTNDMAELRIQAYYFQKKAKEKKVVNESSLRSEKELIKIDKKRVEANRK